MSSCVHVQLVLPWLEDIKRKSNQDHRKPPKTLGNSRDQYKNDYCGHVGRKLKFDVQAFLVKKKINFKGFTLVPW